ncbi:DMT family transporter [Xenorhabdus griffiniae]|uniref:DMT family transporter n=1 Tax=Xenorhabdus griffiniae TaxID=351672 RepID=UPI00235995A2|nr:DMT family transporter [Xenorhabdus griffiniae]MDC9603972.1 DMT family transporter [Xenorhabdus griffiniae]
MLNEYQKLWANFHGLLSGIFWGLSGVLLALVLKDNTLASFFIIPIIIAFLNDSISLVYMIFYLLYKKNQKAILSIFKEKNNLIISIAAIFGGPMGMSFYILAIKNIGIGYTATISALYPAIGTLISFCLLKDRIHKIGLLGLLLAIVCTMALGYSASTQVISGGREIGFLFAFLCALGWGAEVVISSYGMNKNIPSDIAYFIRQLSSSLGYFILIIVFIHSFPGVIHIFSDIKLSTLLFTTSLAATASYLFYYRAIEKLRPIRAMALNITYSIWAIFFSYLIIGEPISVNLLFICSGVSLGSFLTVVNPRDLKKLRLSLK